MAFPWTFFDKHIRHHKHNGKDGAALAGQASDFEDAVVQEAEEHGTGVLGGAVGVDVPQFDMLKGMKSSSLKLLKEHVGFFSGRVVVACLLLEVLKLGVKRVTKRHKRVRKSVDFTTDVLLPGTFFGPLIGITVGVMELMGRIPPLGLGQLAKYTATAVMTPASTTARMLKGMLKAETAPLVEPVPQLGPQAAIPANSPVAAFGALVGLPVGPPVGLDQAYPAATPATRAQLNVVSHPVVLD